MSSRGGTWPEDLSSSSGAALGVVGALVIVFVANYHDAPGENGGLWPAVVTGAACLIVAGVLFGAVLPRLRHPDRATVVLGILAVLSVAIFWSGLTPVLAAAAASTGTAVARTRTRVIRWVAVVAALGAIIAAIAGSHVF